MKKLFTCLFAIVAYMMGNGQLLPKTDLSSYCPSHDPQYRATCYAYAVTYVAMSAEYNIRHGITDTKRINSQYFSPGIVASYHNSHLPLRSRSLFCGKHGSADASLEILKDTGTYFSTDFDCDCMAYSTIVDRLPESARAYKISAYQTVEIKNRLTNEYLDWIRNALSNKHPVIIGMFQNDQIRNLTSAVLHDSLPDEETLDYVAPDDGGASNHVACIVGYDDRFKNGKGYFLLRNNFDHWGNRQKLAWVPYTYLGPLLYSAYYIEGIIEPPSNPATQSKRN